MPHSRRRLGNGGDPAALLDAPAVSIIMPVYNGERFITQAVASVLAQEFRDWELIVVDDGSTDRSAAILAGLADPRVRVVEQANAGEAAARNTGLAHARGGCIAFLDADDLFLPHALATTTRFLECNPVVASVFTDGFFCDETGAVTGRLSDVRPGPFAGSILEPLVLDPAVIGAVCCTLTRRSAIEASGARFDPALVIGPDWDFWIHLAVTASFGRLDEPTCMYRVHTTNISSSAGLARRRADMIRGRRKVMGEAWFADMTEETRTRFFHNLLVELLDGRIEEQRSLIAGPRFRQLPHPQQARLLRNLAGRCLLARTDRPFALECLERAAALHPTSARTRLLLLTARTAPRAAATLLGIRRRAAAVARRLTSRQTPGHRALARLEGRNSK